MKIKKIEAYQVFDSRGNPTVEAEVTLENGAIGRASVPSGASTGRFEAIELRDGDPSIYNGKSVYQAVENVNRKIAPELIGKKFRNLKELDRLMCELDGTSNKGNLGANAILSVSMACARASANGRGIPLFASLAEPPGALLPLPEIQIIGGGAHSAGRIDVQDFMIICTGAESYDHCLEMTYNVYHKCGELLEKQGRLAGVADEGGYWPEFDSNEQVFEFLVEAIENAGYRPSVDVHLSLDIAASEFFSDGKYHLSLEDRSYTPEQFYEVITNWCKSYPIISIEDPFDESDIVHWKKFTASFGNQLQIIGDDLFTTDAERVKHGHQNGLANSVLIKLNQIGTVSETIDCIRLTQSCGWAPVVSARSGETEDPFISHLAVATNAGQLKVGSFTRSERMVKWNEVIRIKRILADKARFEGKAILPSF